MPTVSLAEILAENGLPADMTLEEFWDQCPWVDPHDESMLDSQGNQMRVVEEPLKPFAVPALKRSLDALGKSVREHPCEKSDKPRAAPPTKVVRLPLWPEAKRGVPNSVLRGALFAAIQGKSRVAMEQDLLAVQQGISIRYTGWQLTQSDLDVWEQILHLARQHPLGTRCEFTARGFLKALGRKTGNKGWLKSALARLSASDVQITHGHRTYFGSLIEGGARDERTGHYVLKINPELAALYTAGRWTAVDWEQRKRLRGKPLALWLQGFYASHAEPHALGVEYLHGLSGSRTKRLRKFKENLVQALRDLETSGAIRSFEIKNDLVHVETIPSRSQKKHLSKPRPRRK